MSDNASQSLIFLCYDLFENGIPLIVPDTHYADSKAQAAKCFTPLQCSVGDLDVDDAWGGA
jgi:hypothetical protein